MHLLDLFHAVPLNHPDLDGPPTNGRIRLSGMNAFAAPHSCRAAEVLLYLLKRAPDP